MSTTDSQWDSLCAMQPALRDVEAAASRITRPTWHDHAAFTRRLRKLVGHEAPIGAADDLCTAAAYATAVRRITAAMGAIS